MTLTLSFPPDIESRLRVWAAASGKDIESIVLQAVEEKPGAGASNGTGATLRELVGMMRSFPPVDDGWAGDVKKR